MYIITDRKQPKYYLKGITEDKEYPIFTCHIKNALKIATLEEAEQIAERIKGIVKEEKK